MKEKDIYNHDSMFKGAPVSNFLKAITLREKMTEAESLLWDELRNNKFFGYKFRRQHPIQLYIADFYCHKLKLIIEIDGEYHEDPEQKKSDAIRTEILKFQGLEIVRFKNEEVFTDMEGVLKKLQHFIPPPLLPQP